MGRWPAVRSDFGAGLVELSLEGGLLELRLFLPKRVYCRWG